MEHAIKTVGVLTSGGDAPGMNAAIRAVVRAAISRGFAVKGIRHGYNGLISGDIVDMNLRSVSEIIHRGGTILYTARCLEFKTLEGQKKAAESAASTASTRWSSSAATARSAARKIWPPQGIPCVGIPGTIDNDIACSDYTIGYDTAMNNRRRDDRQAARHHPEPRPLQRRGGDGPQCGLHRAEHRHRRGRAVHADPRSALRPRPRRHLPHEADAAHRQAPLHHPDRGGRRPRGRPCERDPVPHGHRLARHCAGSCAARRFAHAARPRHGQPHGYHAIELLARGIYNRVVATRAESIVDYDISVALSMYKTIDTSLLDIATGHFHLTNRRAKRSSFFSSRRSLTRPACFFVTMRAAGRSFRGIVLRPAGILRPKEARALDKTLTFDGAGGLFQAADERGERDPQIQGVRRPPARIRRCASCAKTWRRATAPLRPPFSAN